MTIVKDGYIFCIWSDLGSNPRCIGIVLLVVLPQSYFYASQGS